MNWYRNWNVDKLLEKDIKKGKITQADADATRSRITGVKGIEQFQDVDLAIEVCSFPFSLQLLSLSH